MTDAEKQERLNEIYGQVDKLIDLCKSYLKEAENDDIVRVIGHGLLNTCACAQLRSVEGLRAQIQAQTLLSEMLEQLGKARRQQETPADVVDIASRRQRAN